MIPFILRRLLWSIPLLGVVSILSFVLTSFSPGSVAATMLSTGATPEAVQDLNNRLGLNLPLYEQYWNWLSGILFHASLGNSLLSNAPVTALLMDRLPVTLSLTFLTLAFCSLLGVTLGFVSAVRGGVLARFVDSFSLIAMSLPSFLAGRRLHLNFRRHAALVTSFGIRPVQRVSRALAVEPRPTCSGHLYNRGGQHSSQHAKRSSGRLQPRLCTRTTGKRNT